ncbi:hypothetical protein T4B_10240 [Trichinella pseudospiralis]|uniref:Uncharacterized protein n=1 Tax=Trichinella pseudospiralis TaxID=6337 RepID=A0A0V1JJG2_TRIPS|nr:hypothetical protein T4A_8513 [Trichinella pseudospiralis]KRZ34709.1 hypothetical protein T4B_10240 [Trichinella pseudospiralis]KRZ38015.1 hypothetical protein T4C_1327 [Trichinella pseudospiralis]
MMAQATQSGHGRSKPSTTQGTDLDQCLKYIFWINTVKNECNSTAKYHCELFCYRCTKQVDVENCQLQCAAAL